MIFLIYFWTFFAISNQFYSRHEKTACILFVLTLYGLWHWSDSLSCLILGWSCLGCVWEEALSLLLWFENGKKTFFGQFFNSLFITVFCLLLWINSFSFEVFLSNTPRNFRFSDFLDHYSFGTGKWCVFGFFIAFDYLSRKIFKLNKLFRQNHIKVFLVLIIQNVSSVSDCPSE